LYSWGSCAENESNTERFLSVNIFLIEGNLEVKLPTISTDGKTEVGRVKENKGNIQIREEKKTEETRSRRAKK
jgi:hypothetical protein